MKRLNKIRCSVPVELEDEGTPLFRIFYRECDYNVNYYQVRNVDGDLISTHNSLNDAKQDANERHAIILKIKNDE